MRVPDVRASLDRFSLPLADFVPLQLPDATQFEGLLEAAQFSVRVEPRVIEIFLFVLFARTVTDGGFITVIDLPVHGVRIKPLNTTAIPQLKL